MSQAINYPTSDSRIISLFLFLSYLIFVLPFKMLKNLLFFNWKSALKVTAVFSFFFSVIFLGFLVFQLNNEASERYLISKYEKNLDQLTKDSQGLEVKFSKANSIKGATDLAQKLNFEKISQISYIKLPANKVVKK